MPNQELVLVTKTIRVYRYAGRRYYVYDLNHTPLGDIYFNLNLNCHVFDPCHDILLNYAQLHDISNFMRNLLTTDKE